MDQGAQTIWTDWNNVPPPARPAPAPLAHEDVEAYLRAAQAALAWARVA